MKDIFAKSFGVVNTLRIPIELTEDGKVRQAPEHGI